MVRLFVIDHRISNILFASFYYCFIVYRFLNKTLNIINGVFFFLVRKWTRKIQWILSQPCDLCVIMVVSASTNCSANNYETEPQVSVISMEHEQVVPKVIITNHVILIIDCNYYLFNGARVDDVDYSQASN